MSFLLLIKGQIISKWFFGVFDFLQKTNQNKLTWGVILVKSNSFVRFLEEIKDTNKPFWNYLTFTRLHKVLCFWQWIMYIIYTATSNRQQGWRGVCRKILRSIFFWSLCKKNSNRSNLSKSPDRFWPYFRPKSGLWQECVHILISKKKWLL